MFLMSLRCTSSPHPKMYFSPLSAFFTSSFIVGTLAATYHLSDNHVGADFLSTFTHEAIADPTHGRVYGHICASYRPSFR